MVSWAINNEGKYSLSELSSGKVRGYSSSGNSLIVKDIMMNDPRDAYVYGCWIQSTNTTTRFTLNNQFLLYVAGEYQCVYDIMCTTVFIINFNVRTYIIIIICIVMHKQMSIYSVRRFGYNLRSFK